MNDRVAPVESNLASRAARGALITLAGQGGRIALQFLSVIVLARLLAPEDFGLLAMATAFIGVGELLRDFGLSSAAIQAKELNNAQRDNLWWMNFALGIVLAAGIYFAAPLIAGLFGSTSLVPIVQWLALVILLGGASTQYRASMTREMKFGKLVLVDLISPAIGLFVGIVGALVGWGPFALVAQQIATAGFGLLFVLAASWWIPRRPRRHVNMRPFLTYGGNLLLSQALIYSSKNVDTVVLGIRYTPAQVGIYDRAFQLLMVPLLQLNSPFTRVALPTLSKLQDNPEVYARYLLRAQTLLMYFTVTVLAFGASQAVPLINIVLGPAWSDSAYILQILAVGGVFHVVYYSTMWVFLSKALTKQYLYFTIVSRVNMVSIIIVGSNWGIAGVAWGYSLGLAIQWPLGLWWIRKEPGVSARSMLLNGCKIILLLALAAAPGFAVSTIWRPYADHLNLAMGSSILLFILILATFSIQSIRGDFFSLVDALKRALKR